MAAAHPALTPEHEAMRDSVRRFVARELTPHAADWDEAGEFPRELYRKAAAAGLLGVGFPEEYGGAPADLFHHVILSEEIAQCGSGGVHASLFSHSIGAPPIASAGSAAMKARVLPGIIAGEKISALAITEPSGGSDVAQLRTTAKREGAHFVVNGRKSLHHLRGSRRLLLGGSEDRRPRRCGRVAAPHRARHAGLHPHAAEENGLVVLGHRAAEVR